MQTRRALLLALLLLVLVVASWMSSESGPTEWEGKERSSAAGRQVLVVDSRFAQEYPEVILGLRSAGGVVKIFDFPGAELADGDRYSWVRDYGPLSMPVAGSRWSVWDAINGGSATPVLESRALVHLARALGAPYRRLDLKVQGGNWILLPDRRVITTTRFFDSNRTVGDRGEIVELLRGHGISEVIEIAPLPGELTGHADMVLTAHPSTGVVFVGELWPEAIRLIPDEPGWEQYREIAGAMRRSLEQTYQDLRTRLGADAVFRFPQPLPFLDRHPDRDAYRPCFPSFVNGVFVTSREGQTTYVYGVAGRPPADHYYSFDVVLLPEYRAAMEQVASEQGFGAKGVQTRDLILHGGSVHCATVECVLLPRQGFGKRLLPIRDGEQR